MTKTFTDLLLEKGSPTQVGITIKTGIHTTRLSQIFSGRVMPYQSGRGRLSEVTKLARYFGISKDELIKVAANSVMARIGLPDAAPGHSEGGRE